MNKNQFRIVFNHTRGLMMAVGEHVKSHTSACCTESIARNSIGAEKSHNAQQTATIRPLVFSVMLSLGMVGIVPNPLSIHKAYADIIADQAAPVNQRPVIINAPNGIHLVNIQTPSAAGVSRNTYSQFDVNTNGAILNNSRTNVQTQLGGFVQGNPYLATGTARIILNEVNSQNPSLLNGYIEVAGSRAQVVIANPAGISCDGCGFINASRNTLTTGTPVINGGDLIGYRVTGGIINLLGAGLDASQSNFTDIIARAVHVNAGVFANNLNVITGTNQVHVASAGDISNVVPIVPINTVSNPVPSYALDVAALGGMYAGKIHMIGTEAGLGVNNAGTIGAGVGEISLTVDGRLTNVASIASTTQTNIRAQNILNTGGTLSAGQELNLNTSSLSGDGKVLSGGNANITLNSDYIHTNTAGLLATGNLTLSTTGKITNQASILAGNTLTLIAANIDNSVSGEIIGTDTSINVTNTLINRGLIDGSNTFITANTLRNTGTGSVFGDHLAVQVSSLNNQAETLNSIETAAIIAARTRLDIGAQNILNENNSLLFSAGDLAIGGSLDTNHQATALMGNSQTTILINHGATIEALGNFNANVADLQNLNAGITTTQVVTGSTAYDQFTPRDTGVILNSADYPGAQIGNFNISYRTAGAYSFREYYRYLYTGTTTAETLNTSLPAQLVAGNNMTLIGNINNTDSKIIAGNLLDMTGASLNNLNTQGINTVSYNGTSYYYDYDGDESCGDAGDGCYDISVAPYNPANTVTTFNLATSQVAQNTSTAGAASGTTVATFNNSPLPVSSLFQTNPNPNSNYLIETNPRFAHYKTWLSSDYLLNSLQFDSALSTKRLGDGFYEQKLIREQVAELTGRRYLTGYATDEAQYLALMTSGVTSAKALNLTPGVALSATQIAQLTSDIVWLVEQEVTLPNGTVTRALVPQVYMVLKAGDLAGTGALISADSLQLDLTGDFNNQGYLSGRRVVNITAENINNLGGQISSKEVNLIARQDINNLGGSVIAEDKLIVNAGNNLNIVSTTQTSQNTVDKSAFSRTNLDRIAGLYVTGEKGILVASAGSNVSFLAASVSNSGAEGATAISAGNNLTLGTVKISEQNNSIRDAKNYIKQGSSDDIGTTIQTSGNTTLIAGKDLNLKAANVTSDTGAIVGIAGGDINIESGEHADNMATARYVKKSGTLSSKKTTTRDTFNNTSSIASTLSANSITLVAGAAAANDGIVSTQQGQGNLNVKGSHIIATNDVNLSAGYNINIVAAEDTHDETHYKQVKQSGLSSSGASVTYGNSKLTNTNDSQQVTNVASVLGSVEGNVNINAGKTYTQKASDILTPEGDIDITAQQVNIRAATDTYNSQQTMKYKQTGITVAVSNPVISAIQTAQQMSKAAKETDDPRMQALAAGTTALAAINAKDAIVAGSTPKLDEHGLEVLDANGKNTADNLANQVGGINVSISIGSSKSQSSSTQTSSSSASSHLTAGGDVNITAMGASKESDINIIGTQIKAANNVSLKAEDQINLIAAQNNETLHSTNKSSSASIGMSVGSNGWTVNASASASKGKVNGTDVTWTESLVQGGTNVADKVFLQSGTDLNLIGTQVKGNQIIADIGSSGHGNLNIQSLQDASTYDSKQKSMGISISVPIGAGAYGGSISGSSTKIQSDYASVNEQAGILAGDGGFQVSVAGNTNLAGAVIASNEQAIEDGKNSLTTETLTVSNIYNKAEYEAKGSSATIGGGLQAGLPQLSGAGIGSDSDKTDSVTLSAVSSGTVIITDNSKQVDLTSKDTITTLAILNRDVYVNEQGEAVDSQGNSMANTIAPIFDQEKVQREIEAQVKITQAFSQEAPRALNAFAQEKTKPYQDANKTLKEAKAELEQTTDPEKQQRLQDIIIEAEQTIADTQADYDKWKEGGEYRIASNIIIAAISGSTSGAVGAITKESLSWAADVMQQKMIEDSMKFPGICDNQGNCLDNKSGVSEGVSGNKFKLAGGRVNIDELCKKDRCAINEDDSLTFTGNLAEFLQSEEGQKMRSPMGGFQGAKGLFAFFDYEAGTIWDIIAEAYAGPHDMLNSNIWYDEQGNIKAGVEETITGKVGNITNYTNVLLATPFALSVLLPPEVWSALMVLVGEN
ncbi:MAG: hemagglutinin repeat-containing protein [Pseudomonadota bacterium]